MKPPRYNHENYETHLYGNWEIHKKPDFFNSYNWHYSRSGSGSIAKLQTTTTTVGEIWQTKCTWKRSKMKRKSLRQMDENERENVHNMHESERNARSIKNHDERRRKKKVNERKKQDQSPSHMIYHPITPILPQAL